MHLALPNVTHMPLYTYTYQSLYIVAAARPCGCSLEAGPTHREAKGMRGRPATAQPLHTHSRTSANGTRRRGQNLEPGGRLQPGGEKGCAALLAQTPTSPSTLAVALTRNPKTPLAMSLNLMSRLQDRDLQMLSTDRNVPEPLRVAARKKVLASTSRR